MVDWLKVAAIDWKLPAPPSAKAPVVELPEIYKQFNPIEEVALIYHFFDYEDGTVELTSLDEEGEYERVYDRFKALQEEVEDWCVGEVMTYFIRPSGTWCLTH